MAHLKGFNELVDGGVAPVPYAITNTQQMDPAAPLINGTIFDRPAFAHVRVALEPNQEVLADGGAMIWMDAHVPVNTEMGSCSAACWRSCSGESPCQNIFSGPGNISFSFKLPGDMLPFGVTPEAGWILTSGAFVCGTGNIEVTSRFSGCYACLCGGEAAFVTKIKIKEDVGGNGVFYAGGYGALTRHEVDNGQELWVSAGLFFAANDQTEIHLAMPGGCIGCMYGGEGLVMKFQGPAVVYTQNRNPVIWRKVLKPRPRKKSKNSAV